MEEKSGRLEPSHLFQGNLLSERGSGIFAHGILHEELRNWLLLTSGFALIIAVAVSGSRSAVASVGLGSVSLLIILVLRPEAVNQFGRSLLLVVILAWGISYCLSLKRAWNLSDRFTEAAQATDSSIAGGLLARTYSGFVEGFRVFDRLPLFGYGLGIGTNAGAKFVTGRAGFLLAEGEWARILLESGPIFGLLFLCWRTALTIRIGWLSLRALGQGEILSVILFSASFIALLDGQFGQPTILGFAVFFSGLCLASTKVGSEVPLPIPCQLIAPPPSPVAKIRGRSASQRAARKRRRGQVHVCVGIIR